MALGGPRYVSVVSSYKLLCAPQSPSLRLVKKVQEEGPHAKEEIKAHTKIHREQSQKIFARDDPTDVQPFTN